MRLVSGVLWKNQPDDHDYPAAASYLSLLAPEAEVQALVDALRPTAVVTFKAKDILRAAGLPLLGTDNPHVASDLAKIAKGKKLSPVLLIRGQLPAGQPLVVADGYHRVCASYHTDEDTDIPCRLAARPTSS